MATITRIKISALLGGYRAFDPGMETKQNLFIYPSGKIIFKDYSLFIDPSSKKCKDVNTKTKYYIIDKHTCHKLINKINNALITFNKNPPFDDVMDGGYTDVDISFTYHHIMHYSLHTPTLFHPLDQCTQLIITLTDNEDLWLFN